MRRPSLTLDVLPAVAFTIVFVALFGGAGAGCLRSLSATSGTTPDGRPSVELCAEVMAAARASASAAPTAVATVVPAVRGTGVE